MPGEIDLGINVDDSDVRRAADSLREFNRRGQEIEAGLRDLSSAGNAASRAISEYDKELTEATEQQRLFRTAQVRATEETKEAARAYNRQEQQLEELRRDFARTEDGVHGLRRAQDRATTSTSRFRAAQGRLATQIRNNRVVFGALAGYLGVGGSGFIGQLTLAARESQLLAETINASSAAILACLLYTSPSPRDS